MANPWRSRRHMPPNKKENFPPRPNTLQSKERQSTIAASNARKNNGIIQGDRTVPVTPKYFNTFKRNYLESYKPKLLDNSPFIPRDAEEFQAFKFSTMNVSTTKLQKQFVRVSLESNLERRGAAKVGTLFEGRMMKHQGAAVHGGDLTMWSPSEWGAPVGKKQAKIVIAKQAEWPTKDECWHEGDGRVNRGPFRRFLPIPRINKVDPKLTTVHWNGVGTIPFRERELARIHPMDRVHQAPKNEEEAYDDANSQRRRPQRERSCWETTSGML